MSSDSFKSNNSSSKNANSQELANDNAVLRAEEVDEDIISSGDELDDFLESLLAEKKITETKRITEDNIEPSQTKKPLVNSTKNPSLSVKKTEDKSFFKKVRLSFGFKDKEEQEWLDRDKMERAVSEKLRLASVKEKKEKLEKSERVFYEKLQFEDEKIKQEKLEQERSSTKKSNKKKLELEQIAKKKAEAERLEQERLAKDKAEKERLVLEQIAKKKAETEKLEQERLTKAKAEKERLVQEQIAKKKVEAERLEQERLAKDKAEKERLVLEQIAKKKAETEKLEQERLTKAKAEKERLVQEQIAKKKVEAERLEKERLAKDKAEKERLVLEQIAKKKAEAERLEQERLAKEKAEKERLVLEQIAKKKAEAERLEQERLAKEKAEKERLVLEKIAKKKAETEKLEQERLTKAKAEKERLVQEQIAKKKVEAERLEKERLAKDKAEKERLVLEQIAKKKAEAERLEQERLAKEKAEKERFMLDLLAKERAGKEKLKEKSFNASQGGNEVKQSFSELAKAVEQQVATIETKPVKNGPIERSVQLCGENADIKNLDLIKKISFNPDDYILSTFMVMLEWAKVSHQLIQLEFSGVTIVIDHKLNTVYCDILIETEKYYDVCNLPLLPAEITAHELNYEETELHKNLRRDKLEYMHSIESFIWTTSLLISHGRLPEDTDVIKKIRLKEELKLNDFETIPHAKKIEKLLLNKQCNLIGISQQLQIPQRYVFAFYNAALNLDMIGINTKKKSKEKVILETVTTKTVTTKVKPSLSSLFSWQR